jgi:nucleotide-binding universal stress UspA family protein
MPTSVEAFMKNIFVLIQDDPGQESRFQAALDLTRAFGGHLSCFQVIVPPDVPPEVAIAVGGGTMLLGAIEREARNRERIQARLANEDVPWTWEKTTGEIRDTMKSALHLADMVVLSRHLDTFVIGEMARVASDVLLGARKPVVAVPEQARGFCASGTALVAWDGSIEAAAAVTICTPLLQLAERVTILEIEEGHLDSPAEEAAAYLSRHGISTLVTREPKQGAHVPDLILQEVSRIGADYIVMGGFSHAQILEALCGGVSHRLLRESPVPLVLMH